MQRSFRYIREDSESEAYQDYMNDQERRRSVSCKERTRECEKHGLPCGSCNGFKPIRRVWDKESIKSHFGISEEEWNYRDTPYPPG